MINHDTHGTPRTLRADARENHERIVRAAKVVLTDEGPRASMNRIAQAAGVGAGTLYRHFPALWALVAAVVDDEVEALCRYGRDLVNHASPDLALRAWLRAVAMHATTLRGLVAGQMLAETGSEARSGSSTHHAAIRDTGAALLARAQEHGSFKAQVDIADLHRLVAAIAWASELAPEDQGLLDRLVALVVGIDHEGD